MDTSCGAAANSASRLPKFHDYIVERALLDMAETNGGGNGLPLWRQQVQYAVGHTLNDYYSLTPGVRAQTPVQFLLERRWPPGFRSFSSMMHYWHVKNRICDTLVRLVGSSHEREVPFMLYEQWHVPVPELQMDLSIIFQLVWHSGGRGGSLNVQKFMVCGNADVARGFIHMANVFCRKTYGAPPESVEIHFLMEGERRRYDGNMYSLEASLDYLRLLSVLSGERGWGSGGCTSNGESRSAAGEDTWARHLLM
ncbi:hypothetical protein J2Z22_002270 [Paenibacillus forsythiae]|uniref:Uncharacterized protein n=1 Tax=Paenibacillus forsythiae TaxID=365616 RepID=A0ABU3H8E8_9BACL|nr:hypothetical protein [Paenibacillus forsythiae]MDT3426736.1 hypothetical protein [Paenibacillus forsythiae]